jgi:hypothetical protein
MEDAEVAKILLQLRYGIPTTSSRLTMVTQPQRMINKSSLRPARVISYKNKNKIIYKFIAYEHQMKY